MEFIPEGYYFFPNLVLYLILLTVKSYDVLQAILNSSQPVSEVGGSSKFCLENTLSPESYTESVVLSIERIEYIMLNLCLFIL